MNLWHISRLARSCVFSELVRAMDLGLGCLRCFAPDVAVVETTHTGKPDNPRTRRWSRFERPLKHAQRPGRVTVPHPKRDLPIGTLKSIERQSGIRLT